MKHLSEEQWAYFFGLIDELESLPKEERESRLAELARSAGDEYVHGLVDLHFRVPGLRSGDGSTAPPAPGTVVVGVDRPRRYRVEQEIGRGGMGVVLGVWDEALARPLAMKILHPRTDTERSRRFLEEAHIAAHLDHPGIAPVHELHTSADGTPYFTMKLVRGRSLAEIFTMAYREEWTTTRAVGLVLKVCETMAYAHERGIIHRDLKPANVMVGEYGEVYVMDWGLARALDGSEPPFTSQRREGPDHALSTREGTTFGTPEYMAPEQAEGQPAAVGKAADIYAVGAMLYHLLAGHPPYHEASGPRSAMDLLAKVRSGPPMPLAEAAASSPAELRAICDRAMTRQPGARYATMLDMASDLRSFLEGRVVRAYETGPVAELRKWVLRNRSFATAISVTVLAILGGAVAVAYMQIEGRRRQLTELLDSDLYLLSFLQEQEGGLGPRDSDARQEIDTWLRQARSVLSREAEHQRRLEKAREVAGEGAVATQQRCELIMDSLHSLSAAMGEVKRRVQLADEALTRYAEEWASAITAIELDMERYGGLRIEPQLGLVPLGMDPKTGLWEFAHLPSGSVPSREPDGRLAFTAASGVVLVLLPGGTFHMGGQSQDPAEPNFAQLSLTDEQPVRQVTLAPFFLAKYEMTQAQWLRVAGGNPSEYGVGQVHGGVPQTLLCPVEKLSWSDADDVLARGGLVLPTEAQWEYAARGGTASLWWTGTDPASLQGAANLADQAAYLADAPFPEFVPFDDGYPVTAPVQEFLPNPFGLHHVYGNVWEWTRDLEGSYELPFQLGDGRRPNPDGSDRVLRGGGCDSGAQLARSAYRYYADADHRDGFAGVRPAAALHPTGGD